MAYAMPIALPGETVEQYMERTKREKQEKEQKEADRQRRIALEAKKNPIWLREQERNQRREAELRALREEKEEQTLEPTRTGAVAQELHMGQHVHSLSGNDAGSVLHNASKSYRDVSPSGSNAGGAYLNGVMNVSPPSYNDGAVNDNVSQAQPGHGPREYDPNAGFDTYALDASGFVHAHGAPLSVSGLHSSPVHGTSPTGVGYVTPGGPTARRAGAGAQGQKGAVGRASVGGVANSKPGTARGAFSTATKGAAPVTVARSQVQGAVPVGEKGQQGGGAASGAASVVSTRSRTAPRVVSRKPSGKDFGTASAAPPVSVVPGRGASLLSEALTTEPQSQKGQGPQSLESAASQVVDLLSPIGKILGPGATFEQVQLAAALVGALTGGAAPTAPMPSSFVDQQGSVQQQTEAPPSPPPAPALAPPPPSGPPPSDAARMLMSPGTAAVAAPGRELPALLPPGTGMTAPPPPAGAPPAHAARVSSDTKTGVLSISSGDPLRITPPTHASLHPQQLALLSALGLPDVASEMQKSMDRVVELEERLALVLNERSVIQAQVKEAECALDEAVSAAAAADREAVLEEAAAAGRAGSPLDGYGPRSDAVEVTEASTEEETPKPALSSAEPVNVLLTKVNALKKEVSHAQAQCDALRTRVAGAQAALAQAELEHTQATEQLHTTYKAELEEVARQPSMEQVQALQELTERTLAAEAEKGRLEVELSSAQRELKSVQEQLKHLKSTGLGAEVESLKSALAEREHEIAALKEAHANEMRSLRLGSVAAAAQAAASAGLESIKSPGKPHGRPVPLREVQRWAAEEAIGCGTPLPASVASGIRAPPPTRESFAEAADGVGAGGFAVAVALRADEKGSSSAAATVDATGPRSPPSSAPSPTGNSSGTPLASSSVVESLEYADILEAMADELSSLRDKVSEAQSAHAAESARAGVVEEELRESLTAAQARALQAEEKLASISKDFNEFKVKYKGTDKIEAKLKELDAAQLAMTTERTEWLAKLKAEHEELQSTFKEARTAKETWLTEMSLLAAERQGMDAERAAREERERLLLQALTNLGMSAPPLPPVPMPAATVQAAAKTAARGGAAKPAVVAVRLPASAATGRGGSPSRAVAPAPSHSNRPPPPPPTAASASRS